VNEIADGLDGAITQQVDVDCSTGPIIQPRPAAILCHMCLRLIGALITNIKLVLPSSPHLYLLRNETTGAFSIAVSAMSSPPGTTVTLGAGQTKFVYCDGANVISTS